MGSFGAPVATLYALLGMDSSGFNEGLAQAKAEFENLTDVLALDMGRQTLALRAAQEEILTILGANVAAFKASAEGYAEGLNTIALETSAFTQAGLSEYAATFAALQALRENDAAVNAKIAADNKAIMEAERINLQELALQDKVLADQVKADAAARVAAEREVQAAQAETLAEQARGATLLGRLGGGWTGAAVARGAFSLSPETLGTVAIAAATYEMVKWGDQAAKNARETQNLAEELGISWTQMRQLQEEASIAGVNLGALQQASGRIASALEGIGIGGKQAAVALQAIGAEGSTSGEVLLDVLNKLSNIADVTQRIAVARAIFGRGSAEIIPLVENTDRLKAAIESLGDTMGGNLRPQLESSAAALGTLGVAWDRLKQSIGSSVFIQDAAGFLTNMITGAQSASKALSDFEDAHPLIFGKDLSQYGKSTGGVSGDWATADERQQIEADSVAQRKASLDQYVQDAKDRKAAHQATLEDLRAELSDAKALRKQIEDELYSTTKPLIPDQVPAVTKSLADNTDRIASLEAAIKSITGAEEAARKAEAAIKKFNDELFKAQGLAVKQFQGEPTGDTTVGPVPGFGRPIHATTDRSSSINAESSDFLTQQKAEIQALQTLDDAQNKADLSRMSSHQKAIYQIGIDEDKQNDKLFQAWIKSGDDYSVYQEQTVQTHQDALTRIDALETTWAAKHDALAKTVDELDQQAQDSRGSRYELTSARIIAASQKQYDALAKMYKDDENKDALLAQAKIDIDQIAAQKVSESSLAFRAANQLTTEFITDIGSLASGKETLHQFFTTLIDDLDKTILKLTILDPLTSYLKDSFSGAGSSGGFLGFIGGLFGISSTSSIPSDIGSLPGTLAIPLLAAGGDVAPGGMYMVGEKGPELFSPSQSGSIIPNSMLSGGGANVNITNVNDFRGADPGSEQRILAALAANNQKVKADTVAAVQDLNFRRP